MSLTTPSVIAMSAVRAGRAGAVDEGAAPDHDVCGHGGLRRRVLGHRCWSQHARPARRTGHRVADRSHLIGAIERVCVPQLPI